MKTQKQWSSFVYNYSIYLLLLKQMVRMKIVSLKT